jgi:transcriptional regulator with XRE-family HTH domain
MEQVLFGERLKNAREASGMSQETMANRLGVKPSTLEKWESGKLHPRANRLQMVASLLNVPLMWLLAGSQNVPNPMAGASNREIMLQKIVDLNSRVGSMKSELDELRVLAENCD